MQIDNVQKENFTDTKGVSMINARYKPNDDLPGSTRLSKHQTILENPGTDVGRQYATLSHFARSLA